MNKCDCGSYAINIDEKRIVCDVCFWRIKYERLEKCRQELIEVTNACRDPRVNLTHTLEQCVREVYDRADAAEAKYQDDLNAAIAIVIAISEPTGHADTFESLTAEWVDRMKSAEAKVEGAKAILLEYLHRQEAKILDKTKG